MIFGRNGKQIKTKTPPIKKNHIVRYDNNWYILDIPTFRVSGRYEWGHARPDKRWQKHCTWNQVWKLEKWCMHVWKIWFNQFNRDLVLTLHVALWNTIMKRGDILVGSKSTVLNRGNGNIILDISPSSFFCQVRMKNCHS